MALEFRVLPDGETIEIKEIQCGWGGTVISHLYFNLRLRKKAPFLTANNQSTNSPDLCQDMTESDIAWNTKHYLPKVKHLMKEA